MSLWGNNGLVAATRSLYRNALTAFLVVLWTSLATPASSQPVATPPPGGESTDSTPITCWWRTDRAAVYVGERFTLTLTCAVVDTGGVRVDADTERLDPAALDLSPFEIISGTRHKDVEAPPRRYFQYSYDIRMLGDESFGRDVDVPSIAVTYNVQSSGVTGTRGRDQVYLLPALPVRVLSLVPIAADDIVDWSPDTFGDIDRRMFRATGEFVASGVFFAFAAVFAAVALVRAARPRAARAALAPRLLPPAAILRACVREAARIQAEARTSGWDVALIDRALTVFRIAGALAIGRPVAQVVVKSRAAVQAGQFPVRHGRLRPRLIVVSGSATASVLAAALDRQDEDALDARSRIIVQDLADALSVLAAARYGRSDGLHGSTLDEALEAGLRGLKQVNATHQWPMRRADAVTRAAVRVVRNVIMEERR